MSTSMQPRSRVRNPDSPTTRRHTRWSKRAAQDCDLTPGTIEKQLYGPDPIHQRMRAMIRAAIQVRDHSTLHRLLDGIERDVIEGASSVLAEQAAYIRRIRQALEA